jgi:hypothetical protein
MEAQTKPRRRRQQRVEPEVVQADAGDAAPVEREAVPPVREALRGDQREETSRERAEREGREILARTSQQDTDFHDDFAIERMGVYPPDGWEYQWKTRTVLGAENPGEMVALEMAGWRAVPAGRHPELMPKGKHYEIIERGGQILMECPKIVTDQQRLREHRKALERLAINQQRLGQPAHGFQRNDGKHAGAQPSINKSYEPIPVPKE